MTINIRSRWRTMAIAAFAPLMIAKIAPAAAAVTEVAYQRVFDLSCSNIGCKVDLPKVPANAELNVQAVSCLLKSPPNIMKAGRLVYFTNAQEQMSQWMAPQVTSTSNVLTVLFNQEMDILFVPQTKASIALYYKNGSPGTADCTVTGVLRTFS